MKIDDNEIIPFEKYFKIKYKDYGYNIFLKMQLINCVRIFNVNSIRLFYEKYDMNLRKNK